VLILHRRTRMQKKSCRYLLPFEHERVRQTDKPRNGDIDRNRQNFA